MFSLWFKASWSHHLKAPSFTMSTLTPVPINNLLSYQESSHIHIHLEEGKRENAIEPTYQAVSFSSFSPPPSTGLSWPTVTSQQERVCCQKFNWKSPLQNCSRGSSGPPQNHLQREETQDYLRQLTRTYGQLLLKQRMKADENNNPQLEWENNIPLSLLGLAMI